MAEPAIQPGPVVVATVLEQTADSLYKLCAQIETGPAAGSHCYVAFRGSAPPQQGRIVVRMDFPRRSASALVRDEAIAGYFVTADVPQGFDWVNSSELLLYGIWENRMRKGILPPTVHNVYEFYDVGGIRLILHYAYGDRGFVVPYELPKRRDPRRLVDRSNRDLSMEEALRQHWQRRFNTPQIVTIDEKFKLEQTVLPVFSQAGLPVMRMQPQQ